MYQTSAFFLFQLAKLKETLLEEKELYKQENSANKDISTKVKLPSQVPVSRVRNLELQEVLLYDGARLQQLVLYIVHGNYALPFGEKRNQEIMLYWC